MACRSRGGVITFTEADTDQAYFYLFNPTFSVDPLATTLTFDYTLEIGAENFDFLVVAINTINYPWVVGDDNADNPLPILLSGSGSIDLTAYRNSKIDLAFGFESSDSLLDSVGTFSNLQINTASAAVPEPATLPLLGIAVLGIVTIQRKRFFIKP